MDDFYTTAQAAPYVNRSVDTLRRWRVQGTGPKFIKVNARLVMYRKEDLDAWNEQQGETSAYTDHDLMVIDLED